MSSESDSLPFLSSEHAAIAGTIREHPEDFRVEEIPAYLPSGEGDHLFVRFEKRELTTRDAVRRIAGALGVSDRDAGCAGMKDRHAVTEQWASFLFGDAAKLEEAEIPGVRILEAARHGNKLRTGHLKGNRFTLRIAGCSEADLEPMLATLEELKRRGAPAYFGPQRFGRNGDNLTAARAWIVEGGRAPRKPFLRKLYVSTLQSAVFNDLLAERIREGTMDGRIPGDLLRKEDTGGLFVSDDPADAARVAAFEVSPTGPMVGARTRWPEGEAHARELAMSERHGLNADRLASFKKFGAGTRRPYRFQVRDAGARWDAEGIEVRFTLPSGAFATVVLRELLRRNVS